MRSLVSPAAHRCYAIAHRCATTPRRFPTDESNLFTTSFSSFRRRDRSAPLRATKEDGRYLSPLILWLKKERKKEKETSRRISSIDRSRDRSVVSSWIQSKRWSRAWNKIENLVEGVNSCCKSLFPEFIKCCWDALARCMKVRRQVWIIFGSESEIDKVNISNVR